MITIVTYIKRSSDPKYIERKRTMYGHAYRFMYVHAEEVKDKSFIDRTKRRFKLTDIEYRSIESDVIAARSAENTRKEAKTATRARLVSHIADIRQKCYKRSSKSHTTKEITINGKLLLI